MDENMKFPTWDPAKETLQEHLDRIRAENERGVNIPVDQEDAVPMDQWNLLEDLYSLENWENLTILTLERLSRDLHKRNLRAVMRLAKQKQMPSRTTSSSTHSLEVSRR